MSTIAIEPVLDTDDDYTNIQVFWHNKMEYKGRALTTLLYDSDSDIEADLFFTYRRVYSLRDLLMHT